MTIESLQNLISSPFLLYGALVLLGIIVIRFQRDRSRISTLVGRIPCPKRQFIFGHSLFFWTSREDRFRSIYNLYKEYTSISVIWIGNSPRVSLMNVKAIENLLSTTKNLDKANEYNFLHPWLGLGLLTSTGNKWLSRRRLITPTFHFRILEDFLEVINEHANVLVSLLKSHQNGQSFNVAPYLSRCTLDIICETAMGKSIHIQNNPESEYFQAVYSMGEIFVYRSIYPWLRPNWLFKRTRYGKQQKEALHILHNFTNQVIKERLEKYDKSSELQKATKSEEMPGSKRRLAFLDMLLSAYAADKASLSLEGIREEVDTFMFEGHDTTATGLTWILYNIGRFPEIQTKIQEELDMVLGDSKKQITTADLADMKYLERVIKESMRLFPPVPFFARKLTEDTEVCGYLIPAGVSVSINVFKVHRDPEHFPDPEKFDPDRFLPENCSHRHPYAYIPFSAGPRNCIGQKFAMMEEKTVTAHILREFNVKSVQKLEDIKLLMELVLRPASGIWLTLEKRDRNVS